MKRVAVTVEYIGGAGAPSTPGGLTDTSFQVSVIQGEELDTLPVLTEFWIDVAANSTANFQLSLSLDGVAIDGDIPIVPLPATLPLMAAAVVGLGFVAKRKKARAA